MATSELQFAAFLSYSRKDMRLARWLVRSLEEFRLPRQTIYDLKARGASFLAARPIFRDEHDMPVGGVISERLTEVLDASATMLVLCTAASARSDWVNQEIELFASRHPDRRIIPAVAEGEPDSDETYPPALLARGKPLAADLRSPSERQQTVVKIAAAMLGLDVDQLVGRVRKRRAAQLLWFATGGGAAAAAVVGLAVTAGVMANSARQANDRAYEQVEQLLTKTRADMDDLAAKKALHEAAKLYFDSKAGRRLSDRDLLLKAEWLRQEGEDAGSRGENEQALAFRREAYAGTSELLKRNPDNPEFLFSHGQSAFWVGYYFFLEGQPDAARPFLEAYGRTADQLHSVAPDYVNVAHETDASSEVYYARFNLGMLALEEERDSRAAAQEFGASLAVLDPHPHALKAKLDLSRAHFNYVSALAQFAPAAEVLQAVDIWRPVLLELESHRADADVNDHLASSWDKIINVFEKHVDPNLLRGGGDKRIQILVEGLRPDPDNQVSLTFAEEMRLHLSDRPDCSRLPPVGKANARKGDELRLLGKCLSDLPRAAQLVRCRWLVDALQPLSSRLGSESVWAMNLIACNKAATAARDRNLSRSLDQLATAKFFNRSFEEMRLWTQFELVQYHAGESKLWTNDLKASLASRGWITEGDS